MGHIFRSLALAHEISDHEIRFVCDTQSAIAANKLAGYDYWLGVYEPQDIEQAILDIEPDMVINDMLNTDAAYVHRLKANGIKVVNFEDLGSGASEADLTINDLYDEPQLPGENILWGSEWFFVRDEFISARPHTFSPDVRRLLITFGGTDPNDLTRKILHAVAPYCAENGIVIDVVTGDGYGRIEALEREVSNSSSVFIQYTHATGVISHIMESCQIAICSNGRTVYELAHMNIPAIVVSHHERENTHCFAQENNGFVSIGLWNGEETVLAVKARLKQLVENESYRKTLFDNARSANFVHSKQKVVDQVLRLLENKPEFSQ